MKTQYREIAKEIGRDVGSLARGGLKGVGKLAVKAAYPVLGNLSANIQGRLENRLGSDVYCGARATEASFYGNFLASSIVGTYIGSLYGGKVMGGVGFILGISFAISEGKKRDKSTRLMRPCGSLGGKVVSLPLDVAKYVSDKAYGYLGEVGKRVEAKRDLESEVGGGE